MKKRLLALLLALILVLGLAACGTGNNNTPEPGNTNNTPNQSNPSTNAPAAKNAVTVAIESVPDALDPSASDLNTSLTVARHIFDKLVEFDMGYNWMPAVAKSWKQVDDLHWEFEINLDYVFQNGDKLTMDDVVFSIERLKNVPKAADAAACIKDLDYKDTTLFITLTEPNNVSIARFLSICFIMNKAYIQANGDEGLYTNAIGTGPYKVSNFVPGSTITVETWDGYPFKNPQVEKITFNAIAERASLYIAVETGAAQYGGFVTGLELKTAESNNKVYGISVSSQIVRNIQFNVEQPPFNDVNVRRAIGHAVNRDAWCMLDGGHDKSESIIANSFPQYYASSNLPEYDLDKARDLLTAAGYGPGNPLSFEILGYRPDSGYELLQADLKQVGVEMKISVLEFSRWLEHESTRTYTAVWVGLDSPSGNAVEDFNRFDLGWLGSRNNTGYQNDRIDAITKILRVSTNESEIMTLFKEASDILAQDVPHIPVYCDTLMAVAVNGLTGVQIRSDMVVNFREAVYNG